MIMALAPRPPSHRFLLACSLCVYYRLALGQRALPQQPSIPRRRASQNQQWVISLRISRRTSPHAIASQHATTTGLVLSGYGLSAFIFSAIAHTFFPGDTSALLRLLAFGTSIPILLALFVVRPVPLPPTCISPEMNGIEGYEPIPTGDMIPLTPGSDIDMVRIPTRESCANLPEDQLEDGGRHSPELPSTVEMGWEKEQSHSQVDALPDIHGIQLLTSPDFYLIIAIIALCKFDPAMFLIIISDDT